MDPDFWQQLWRENRIGFHEGKPNDLLTRHFDRLALKPDSRVFLPLCGKAFDLDWIAAQGHRVAGIELNRAALEEVFERSGLTPEVEELGALTAFRAGEIELFAGDVFDLTADILGPVNATYDRAALIALPAATRAKYAVHVRQLTAGAPQLLICLDYDQSRMDGPPFPVGETELDQLYGGHYRVAKLAERPISGRIGDLAGGSEIAWLLKET
ncbi:MAG: thiopurine S-methyltransferase [Rhizobiaceae bacterium]|nr:thiopurine S-methyltransferase [Rhizobiaceae bacterium]